MTIIEHENGGRKTIDFHPETHTNTHTRTHTHTRTRTRQSVEGREGEGECGEAQHTWCP